MKKKTPTSIFDLFNNIMPAGTLLKNIAKIIDLGVIEIEVGSDNEGNKKYLLSRGMWTKF